MFPNTNTFSFTPWLDCANRDFVAAALATFVQGQTGGGAKNGVGYFPNSGNDQIIRIEVNSVINQYLAIGIAATASTATTIQTINIEYV